MGRLFLLLIVVLGLAPGTWVRAPRAAELTDRRQMLTMEPLAVPRPDLGEMTIAGVWQLRSPNSHFSGYSALVPMGDGSLLALSDRGRMMRFFPPGTPDKGVSFGYFAARRGSDKSNSDLESATSDPASGTIWAGYENTNQIERFDSGLVQTGRVRPRQMHNWPANSGPESIVRLADGRFIVLAEGDPKWFAGDLPALLFPTDPVDGAQAVEFRFAPPEGFVPVDTALLPDGRVLILLREVLWRLPPRFESKLVVADPATIVPGRRWNWQELAHIAAPLPTDNFEGLAVVPGGDSRVTVWLISDDNNAQFQRTLLMKLDWRPDAQAQKKARETGRAPY